MTLDNNICIHHELNLFFTEFIENLLCDTNNAQDLCINCILDMLRGTSLSILTLARTDCLKDIEILIRSQFKRLLKLKKLCIDPTFAPKFIAQSQQDRLKFINIAKNKGDETLGQYSYSLLNKSITVAEFEALKKEVDLIGTGFSIFELAQQTGLLSEYILYRFTSNTAHCAAEEIDDCISIEQGNIKLIPYGHGRLADLIPTLQCSMHIILSAISAVGGLYEIDVQKVSEFRHALEKKG